MNLALRYLFAIVCLFIVNSVNGEDVRSILEKSLHVLNNQKQLSYDYELELNYPSEDYRHRHYTEKILAICLLLLY